MPALRRLMGGAMTPIRTDSHAPGDAGAAPEPRRRDCAYLAPDASRGALGAITAFAVLRARPYLYSLDCHTSATPHTRYGQRCGHEKPSRNAHSHRVAIPAIPQASRVRSTQDRKQSPGKRTSGMARGGIAADRGASTPIIVATPLIREVWPQGPRYGSPAFKVWPRVSASNRAFLRSLFGPLRWWPYLIARLEGRHG